MLLVVEATEKVDALLILFVDIDVWYTIGVRHSFRRGSKLAADELEFNFRKNWPAPEGGA